jgi:hypothetical protein
MKYSCENLTSAIRKLKTLLPRVDLAIRSFEVRDGVVAKDEVLEIFQQYRLRILFNRETYCYLVSVFGSEEKINEALANIEAKGKSGSQLKAELESYIFRKAFKKEAYDYFIKVLGSEEELKKKVFSIETTGKAGLQILAELNKTKLNNIKVSILESPKYMFQSPEFQVAKAGVEIQIVRLQVRTLFSDNNKHTWGEIIAKAKELGLGFLPQEAAADMLLSDETRPKIGEWFIVVSEQIAGPSGIPYVFSLGLRGDDLWLDYSFGDCSFDYELVFGLDKQEE